MKHVRDILKTAGHPLVDTLSSDEEVEACFRAWLGLDNSSSIDENEKEVVVVEDCLPLSDSVFAASVDWLVDAWSSTSGNSSTNTFDGSVQNASAPSNGVGSIPSLTGGGGTSRLASLARNPLLYYAQSSSLSSLDSTKPSVTLEMVYDSVRATKYLRAWMEFNISLVKHSSQDADGETLPLPETDIDCCTEVSRRLAHIDSIDTVDATPEAMTDIAAPSSALTEATTPMTTAPIAYRYSKSTPRHALIRALFQHVQDLPMLQQHMLLYSQRLPNQTPHNRDPHSVIADPSARLQQYEYAIAQANLLQQEWQAHLDRLLYIVGDLYAASNPDQRKLCRRLLGHIWSLYTLQSSSGSGGGSSNAGSNSLRHENTQASAIRLTLQVLHRILLGLGDNSAGRSESVATHLLFHQLIPLHKADGVVLWRDQIAVLELYHETLCQCMAILLHHNRALLVPAVIQQLAQPSIFPMSGSAGKQVLLLHEIDTYLKLLDHSSTGDDTESQQDVEARTERERTMMQALIPTLARCMSSEHSRVAEQALQYFQSNKPFERLVSSPQFLEWSLGILLPALVRREPSWNPTVRKMTYNVLIKLQDYDKDIFAAVSNRLFAHVDMLVSESSPKNQVAPVAPSGIASTQLQASAATRAMPAAVQDFSLKAGMGNWKPSAALPSNRPGPGGSMPPPRSRPPFTPGRGVSGQPGRGMAPWANMPSLGSTIQSKSNAPPLTITGVAPWAVNASASSVPNIGSRRVAPAPSLAAPKEDDMEESESIEQRTGLEYVLSTMAGLKPPHEENGLSSWSLAQMAETPTLLPDLKFHDLVFGHDLGSGAFGSVRYARLIDRAKPRSQWAEYAVKVVSTEKIRELGYEASIQREIAVLRLQSHPGIARLVSSFRFQSGAYLVLEYASRGDLHTLLQKHGSLDEDSTRFVMGEVVAALASIHEGGFVYGDLKPENVVITETGHIKLTDFGGCRPVTDTARALVKSIAKDILKNMRDGDWKESAPSHTSDSGSGGWGSDENDKEDDEDRIDDAAEDDERIEGTTSYLPPEVVMGAFPTIAADAWALGCVMYQCLSGRPPLLESDDVATKNRIVSFDLHVDSTSSSELDRLFSDKHAVAITTTARDMISLLLNRDASKRPGMNDLAEHDFFSASNVFELYSKPAYPMDVGAVAPNPNAEWSRRQFSSIWAPQPVAYNISLPLDNNERDRRSASNTNAPILEGEEASGYFTPSGRATASAAENFAVRQ